MSEKIVIEGFLAGDCVLREKPMKKWKSAFWPVGKKEVLFQFGFLSAIKKDFKKIVGKNIRITIEEIDSAQQFVEAKTEEGAKE